MLLNTRYFVSVLIIVLMLWKVSKSNNLVMIEPSKNEIVVDEGDSVKIICNSNDTKIHFMHPNKSMFWDYNKLPKISHFKKNETIYEHVFLRPSTVSEDTGWYGCCRTDVVFHYGSHYYDNHPYIKWIYVYIKSRTHFFLKEFAFRTYILNAVAGEDIEVPCRTTSPELVPTLYGNRKISMYRAKDEKMEKPYNPRHGFTMKNLTVEDSDIYRCSIEKDGIKQDIYYILHVQLGKILYQPIIDVDKSNFLAKREEDLYLKCIVLIDIPMFQRNMLRNEENVFNWITPQQNSKRIRINYMFRTFDEKTLEITCHLTIFNVTNKDAGEYACYIKSPPPFYSMRKTTINITLHDIHRKYINLTSQNPTRFYQREVGNNVEWLVFFDGYPEPHVQWKKYNYNITTEDNYSINTTPTFTVLKINSLRLMDAGVYTLVAKNQYKTEQLNFTLKVADKPISKLANVKSYYAPNENAEFYCIALSLRTVMFLNITWNFLKCLDFPSCKNLTIIHLTDVSVMEQEPFMFYKNFTSAVRMPIEMPGKIKCEACNAVGCRFSIETVLVSDGIGNFSIIRPKEAVIKGDNVEFTCVASVYYFGDKLRWENWNKTLIVESEKRHIMQNKTQFTYRSTIKIINVQKSDAMIYICVGESTSLDTVINKTYKLIVHDPVEPLFYDTNMNQTIVKDIDMNTDDYNTLILKCFAKGMPTPKVTWFKDNAKLKEDNQYSFKFDNQELHIKYLKQNVSGKYLCRATNQFGTNEIYQQIRIKNAVDFFITGPTESVIKGDNVKLTCVASVSFYTEKLTWVNITKTEKLRIVMHNNTQFTYRSTLEIDNVQKSDAENYTCAGEYMISNDDNTSFTIEEIRHYELVVHDPEPPVFYKTNMNETMVKVIEMFPENGNGNENVTLQCFAKGMPTPNVTWFKDNTMLEEDNQYYFKFDNQELNIKYLKQNDNGKYLCRATNRFGTSEIYQQIRIKIKLSGIKNNFVENFCINNFVDKFYIIGPKESVVKHDDVKLTCFASISSYTNELMWINLIKTEKLRIVQNNTLSIYQSTLEIDNVQESDAKNYTCAGEYIISNDNSTFFTMKEIRHYELLVHDPVPPFFYKTNMNKTIAKSIEIFPENYKTVTLQCFVKGIPTPNVTWFKDNIPLIENDQYSFKFDKQELNIKYLKQNDSGKYLCRATNRFGTNETYQHIIIQNVKSEQKLDVILAISIAVLGIISMILGIFITIKVRREKKLRKELKETGLMHFMDGALECLNPDLTVENQAELLPYDKKWEFPRERLKLGKQLGSGAFGVVMKAEALGIRTNEIVTTVAVKMVRRTTDLTYIRALASELKIMVHLGKHLNVVNLLGACTKNIFKRELLVIVEYCCFGNLHNYLLKHRINFINQIDSKTGKIAYNIGMEALTKMTSVNTNNSLNTSSDIANYKCSKTTSTNCEETSCSTDGYIFNDKLSQSYWKSNYDDCNDQNLKSICTQDLLSWAFQVARGMEYLSQRRVLHGDLAARNILLSEDNVVKICDFGLAKSMYKDADYQKKSTGPLPIKWMAIESMKDRIFSTQSDIWSFGIILWEFFSLAETPYPGIEVEKLYPKLIEGYRMEQPKYANREIYDIMLQCWKAEPILRPSFTNLVESIGNLVEESVKFHYINLNIPYMNMNTESLESGKTDYLTMMSAPDHAIFSSTRQDYVNMKSEQAVSEDASNSSYLCMNPGNQTDKSLIFSSRQHQDDLVSELPSDLQTTFKLLPAKQINSTIQVPAEIDSKSNDFISIIHTSDN